MVLSNKIIKNIVKPRFSRISIRKNKGIFPRAKADKLRTKKTINIWLYFSDKKSARVHL